MKKFVLGLGTIAAAAAPVATVVACGDSEGDSGDENKTFDVEAIMNGNDLWVTINVKGKMDGAAVEEAVIRQTQAHSSAAGIQVIFAAIVSGWRITAQSPVVAKSSVTPQTLSKAAQEAITAAVGDMAGQVGLEGCITAPHA